MTFVLIEKHKYISRKGGKKKIIKISGIIIS